MQTQSPILYTHSVHARVKAAGDKPKDALSDYTVELQNFLWQCCLYPWQLSFRKPILLQRHHLRQWTSEHRRHVNRWLQNNTTDLWYLVLSMTITEGTWLKSNNESYLLTYSPGTHTRPTQVYPPTGISIGTVRDQQTDRQTDRQTLLHCL